MSEESKENARGPVSLRIAMLCIVLGLFCFAFPFFAYHFQPNLFSGEIYRFSLSTGFGLFLTAVGGWASGKWRGWTFGGAAATVVALFLLLQFFAPEQQDTGRDVLIAKIDGPELYSEITAIEVMEDNAKRLFVAPNRELNHAQVLIESSNLDTDCLAFILARNVSDGRSADQPDSIAIRVPSEYFRQQINSSKPDGPDRRQTRLYYHHKSMSLLKAPPTSQSPPEPVHAPGVCGRSASIGNHSSSSYASMFGWVSQAFAQDAVIQELIKRLVDSDALIRRDARDQIAKKGPSNIKPLMTAIPNRSHSDHYRLALGAVTAIAKMPEAGFKSEELQNELAEQDIKTIANLLIQQDKTMQNWAANAITAIADHRFVPILADVLKDENIQDEAKYAAALSLRDIYHKSDDSVQNAILDSIKQVVRLLEDRTQLLLSSLISNDTVKTGWVYVGVRYTDKWAERHFSWDGDSADNLKEGLVIEATGNVNIRADHIRFTLENGWQNSEIVGLVRRGKKITVRNTELVAGSFLWAEIVLEP